MKVANLSRAKNDLSRYVAYVRRGGRVRIMVSGVPAADMVPVTGVSVDAESDEDVIDLERHGVVRRGTGGVPLEILKPGPKLRGEPSAAAVVAERADGW
jgi:antitoxin (DNA-binding transcriptional repressor) of toxin-antitoxin stability system